MLRAVVYLFRFLLALLLLRLVFRFIGGVFQGYRQKAPRCVAPKTGVPLVRDRVCNTFLPRDRALHVLVGGREEFFCSTGCRDRALADSARSQDAGRDPQLPRCSSD